MWDSTPFFIGEWGPSTAFCDTAHAFCVSLQPYCSFRAQTPNDLSKRISFHPRHLSTSIFPMTLKTPANSYTVTLCCLLFLLLVPGTASSAKVYKWVDKNGQVHFGQTPPNAESNEYDVRFAKEKAPPPAPVKPENNQGANSAQGDASPQGKTKPEKKLTPQEKLAAIEKARAEQAKKAQEEVQRKAAKMEKCKQAQSNMRNVSQGGRIYDVDESGERHYWDDKKRAEKKKQAQEYIEKFCEYQSRGPW